MPFRNHEILREVVDHLREMRRNGARTMELVDYLETVCPDDAFLQTDYLKAAFKITQVNLFMMRRTPDLRLIPEILNDTIDPRIDEAPPEWGKAEPYPDLHRRRDREVFRTLAKETGNIFFICAANPFSAQYVGRPGYRTCPWYVPGVVRTEPPNAGLVAWSPAVPEGRLYGMGFRIMPEDEGFIIRDAAGAAFFPGYELHGVYDGKTGANAWTGREGERLRAELNRGFGLDLVQVGPRDVSERRRALPPSDPDFGPKLPVLQFSTTGNVPARFPEGGLSGDYAYHHIAYSDYYP